MLDYIFGFESEAQAVATLPAYRVGGEDGSPDSWRGDCVLPVQVGVAMTYGGTDEETGEPILIPVYAAGYWLVVSSAAVDEALWAVPACMREADRERAAANKPFVLRDRFSPEQLAQPYWITPVWAGARYPFEPPPVEATQG